MFDMWWWLTYSLKYQHDVSRLFYNSNTDVIPEYIRCKVHNFYETYDFHQWSFHNHHLKMKDKFVWASYKEPLKEIILQYTRDREYYSTKLKVASV
jgi:hypothetical protein